MSLRNCASITIVLLLISIGCSGDKSTGPIVPAEPAAHESWEDEEAENLAWLISGHTWAPRELYERIRDDLLAIRQRWSDSLENLCPGREHDSLNYTYCRHRPEATAGFITLIVSSYSYEQMTVGNYHDWDSLNESYHATVSLSGSSPSGWVANIVSTYRPNPYRMIENYEQLPGVRSTFTRPDYGISTPRFNVYAYQYDWGIGYLFGYNPGGPCGLDCPPVIFQYFRSENDEVTYVGRRDPRFGEAEPEWWSEASKAVALFSRGDNEYQNRDVTPPAEITDLALDTDQFNKSAVVTFISPGNDGFDGPASTYEFGWSAEPFTDSTWPRTRAGYAAGPAGSKITITLNNLLTDTVNYVGVRTYDGRNNRSRISNLIVSRNVLLDGWTYHPPGANGLPSSAVTKLHVDQQGVTWAGTKHGAARLVNGQWEQFTVANGALPSDYVTAFGGDADGNVWVGTLQGAAVFDGSTWQTLVPTGGLGGVPEIRCITSAPDGSVWCGVGFDGAARFDGSAWEWFDSTVSGIRGSVVRDILFTSNGDMWVATDKGINQFDGSAWTFHVPVSDPLDNHFVAMLEDQAGSIVCGTTGGRLARFNGLDWDISRIVPTNPYGPGSPFIHGMVEMPNGDLWLDSYESLRWYAGGDDNALVLIDTNSGLPERDITALVAGPGNTLWIGTKSSGVCQWDLSAAGIGKLSDP